MEKKLPPNETRYNDLVGVISIDLQEGLGFNDFASQLAGYDPAAYEAVAIRVFYENSPVITVYAKYKNETSSGNGSKLKVHKFKKEIELSNFFNKLKEFNFTVTTGDMEIDNMEVVNK